MNKLVLYIHGKGGSPDEEEHYKALFPQRDVLGLDYHAQTPWEANQEFPALFHKVCKGYDSVILIANSISAFFAMNSLRGETIEQAFFIFPIVNMEKLICDIRAVYWKQWKKVKTKYRMLKALGLEHWKAKELACSRKGHWRMAQVLNQIFSNKIIVKLGYTSMLDYYLVVCEN